MPETFLQVPGWPAYEVSNLGRVRRGGRILSGRRHTNGYLRVNLCGGASQKDAYIHRLVLLTFVGEPSDGDEADHLNCDRADNRLENLRWLSSEENKRKRRHHKGADHHAAKLTEPQVIQILRSRENNRVLSQSFGISREQVRDIRLRKVWRHVHG